MQATRLQQVIDRDLSAFNNELRRLNLPPISPPCQAGQRCTIVT